MARKQLDENDDMNTDGKDSMTAAKKVGWTVYSIILLAIIAGLAYYTFLVMNGTAYSYGKQEATSEPPEVEIETISAGVEHPDYIDTPEVKELTKLPVIDVKEIKGEADVAVFRNPEASIICGATTDFQKHPANEWIPKWVSVEGKEATGPGVECAILRAIPFEVPNPNGCPENRMAGHAYGLSTNEGPLKGMCWNEPSKLFEDVRLKENKRYEVPELPFGYRVEIGNYSCAYTALEVTCADVTTGKGMTIDDQSVNYFGVDE